MTKPRMDKSFWSAWALAVGAAAAVLTGCGGGNGSPAPAPARSSTAGAAPSSPLPSVADPAAANGFVSTPLAIGTLSSLPVGPLYVDIEQVPPGAVPTIPVTRDCMMYTLSAPQAVAQLTVPVIGITLSLVWMISIPRTRERRRYAENRMVEIESTLHASWKIEGTPIGPLDIGTRARWEEIGKTGAWGKLHLGWIRDIQPSKLALALPPAFIIIWVVLFVVL